MSVKEQIAALAVKIEELAKLQTENERLKLQTKSKWLKAEQALKKGGE